MNKYIPVIGLEIHVELKTKSKMFCQCAADYFGKKPNTHSCPVCLGLPGVLPVPNQQAVDWTILVGKALNCKINKQSKFDRKHYFYPDLPKGYQISQYDQPIAIKGLLKLKTPTFVPLSGTSVGKQNSNVKTFGITRVHLEEDTGKLIHKEDKTLIDFNRSGVPLVEIVTEPDFDNADDVKRFLEELQVIIRYLGVSDADMEKGSMRLEPNISLKVKRLTPACRQGRLNVKHNKDELPNYKVEIKNINSFRFVKQAIEYEIERQTVILEKGETPRQETRGYDEKKQITYSQRSKEEAHDYRYFPEPDIPPMSFSDSYLEDIEKNLPELPHQKIERFQKKYNLRPQDSFILTRDRTLSDIYEDRIVKSKDYGPLPPNFAQGTANMIINKKIPITLPIDEFIKKDIELLTPKITDHKLLKIVITKIIKQHKKVVDDYKKGKENAIMFLVGQVIREMKGKADPKTVIEKLKQQLV